MECSRVTRAGGLGVLLLLAAAAPVQAIAYSPINTGDLVVANQAGKGVGNGNGFILEVDSGSGARDLLSSTSGTPQWEDPRDLVFEPGGKTYFEGGGDGDAILVVDQTAFGGGGGVIRLDPDTDDRMEVSSATRGGGPAFNTPVDIALEADGNILVVDEFGHTNGHGAVVRVDPDTGQRTLVSDDSFPGTHNFGLPTAIALEEDGSILVANAGACGSACIIRVDPVTGYRTTTYTSTIFVAPLNLPTDAAGLYVADGGVAAAPGAGGSGAIVDLDLGTGVSSILSRNGGPAGVPDFQYPSDVEVSGTGSLYVVDELAFCCSASGGRGGVIRVDPASGDRTRISRNSNPSGAPIFVYPWGLAIAPVEFRMNRHAVSVIPVPRSPGSGDRATTKSGATFKYTLGEKARVVFKIDRRVRGRIVGSSCRKETPANKTGPRCTLHTRVGQFSDRGERGTNRKRFSGSLRGKAMRSGSYQATIRATTRGGDRSMPIRVPIRVLKR